MNEKDTSCFSKMKENKTTCRTEIKGTIRFSLTVVEMKRTIFHFPACWNVKEKIRGCIVKEVVIIRRTMRKDLSANDHGISYKWKVVNISSLRRAGHWINRSLNNRKYTEIWANGQCWMFSQSIYQVKYFPVKFISAPEELYTVGHMNLLNIRDVSINETRLVNVTIFFSKYALVSHAMKYSITRQRFRFLKVTKDTERNGWQKVL